MSRDRFESLTNLRLANLDGAFSNAFASMAGGSILVGFIKYLGASDFWILAITLCTGSSVFSILQIPGAVWGRRFASYKRFVTPGGNLTRLFYVPLIFLPLIAIPPTLKLTIMVVCVAIASASNFLVATTYSEWLAELVPPSSRGWFYSRRNAISTMTSALGGVLAGGLVGLFEHLGREALGYSVVFALASVFSAISLHYYLKMSDTPREHVVHSDIKETFRDLAKPFVNRNFRRVLTYLFVAVFAQGFTGNFIAAFTIESLHMPLWVFMVSSFTQAIGTTFSLPFMGALTDKYGNKPVLILAGFGTTFTPLMYLFCQPDQTFHNALLLWTITIPNGVIWAAIVLTQFNILLSTSPPEERASYLGTALTVQAAAGFVGPLLGALVLNYFRGVMPTAEVAYKSLFVVMMSLRFLSVFFLFPVMERGSKRVGTTLKDLSRLSPSGLSAMRSMGPSADPSAREDAIRRVGTQHLSMATTGLIAALQDPAPRIRRQAAASLALVGDRAAVEALIDLLKHHPDIVEPEWIETLGRIGGRNALPILEAWLGYPGNPHRATAIRALAQVGDTSAVPMLESVEDEVREAIHALKSLGAKSHTYANRLTDDRPTVRLAAAEAIAELGIAEAAPALRASLDQFRDEASSEAAYALGAVGETADIPRLLQHAQSAPSTLSRRRSLLGVARLLEVEPESYRLMLLEGMTRDAALLTLMRTVKHDHPYATSSYSHGDEVKAVENLLSDNTNPLLEGFREIYVEEAFLVLVSYLAKK